MENEDEPRRTVIMTQYLSSDNNWYIKDEEGNLLGFLMQLDLTVKSTTVQKKIHYYMCDDTPLSDKKLVEA